MLWFNRALGTGLVSDFYFARAMRVMGYFDYQVNDLYRRSMAYARC